MSSFKLIELLFPTPVVETVKPPAVFKPSLLICGVNTSDCVQLLINAETFATAGWTSTPRSAVITARSSGATACTT